MSALRIPRLVLIVPARVTLPRPVPFLRPVLPARPVHVPAPAPLNVSLRRYSDAPGCR